MIFRRLYDKLPKGNTNIMKKVKFFGTLCLSVNLLVNLLPMNSPTNQKLSTIVFSTNYYIHESVGKYLPMNFKCKYQWKFSSVKLLNLLVRYHKWVMVSKLIQKVDLVLIL